MLSLKAKISTVEVIERERGTNKYTDKRKGDDFKIPGKYSKTSSELKKNKDK